MRNYREVIFFGLFILAFSTSSEAMERSTDNQWKASLGYALKHYSYWQTKALGPEKIDSFVPNQFAINIESIRKNNFSLVGDIQSNKIRIKSSDEENTARLNSFTSGIFYNNWLFLFSWQEMPLFKQSGTHQFAEYAVAFSGMGYKKEMTLNSEIPTFMTFTGGLLIPLFIPEATNNLKINKTRGLNARVLLDFHRLIRKFSSSDLYIAFSNSVSYTILEHKIGWEDVRKTIDTSELHLSTSLGIQVRF